MLPAKPEDQRRDSFSELFTDFSLVAVSCSLC